MADAKLIAALLAQADARHGGKIDGAAEEALLDYAFDELGYDGDELDLLDALRAARRPTRPRQAATSRGRSPASRERERLDAALVSAPYRFVALPDKIVPADEAARTARLDQPLQDGFCGTIEVEWRFETPVLIGQGEDVSRPAKLGEQFVIPGATIRGLLRAAVETVTHGRISQANRHHHYGVRDFEHPLFSDDMRPLWDNIGSAWLRKAGDDDPPPGDGDSDYVLEPCAKRTIRIRDLPDRLNGGRPTDDGRWHLAWLGKELDQRYAAADMTSGKLIDFTLAGDFAAGPGETDVRAGGAGFRGVLVFSGKSPTIDAKKRPDFWKTLDREDRNPGPGNQKKREYVFADRPTGASVRLRKKVWDRFCLMNSKPARNKRVADGSWAKLEPTLLDGRRIPVFFNGALQRQEEPGFDIGLTRLFKRGHDKSAGDVLVRAGHGIPEDAPPDIATALFGHVYEDDERQPTEVGDPEAKRDDPGAARKGRVAVGFARLSAETPAKEGAPIDTVMMGPRASFAPFYLAGDIKDWSGDAKPAGRKVYPPRFGGGAAPGRIYDILRRWRGDGKGDDKLLSRLRYLEPAGKTAEIAFVGKLRLHNVTAVEIGALLWALCHGGDPAKPCRHMIGRGRGAGAGQARVTRVLLRLRANDKAGQAMLKEPERWELPDGDAEGWTSKDGRSMGPFLRALHGYMRAKGAANWPETPTVREFVGASDPAICRDLKRNYLDLVQFRKVRDAVKAAARTVPAKGTPDRLLAAPAAPRVGVPYVVE